MPSRVVLITKDADWSTTLQQSLLGSGIQIVTRPDVYRSESADEIDRSDAVLIDVSLIPRPPSSQLTTLSNILAGKPVVAVYGNRNDVDLCHVRAAFIAGARDLVAKPYSELEFQRQFSSRTG